MQIFGFLFVFRGYASYINNITTNTRTKKTPRLRDARTLGKKTRGKKRKIQDLKRVITLYSWENTLSDGCRANDCSDRNVDPRYRTYDSCQNKSNVCFMIRLAWESEYFLSAPPLPFSRPLRTLHRSPHTRKRLSLQGVLSTRARDRISEGALGVCVCVCTFHLLYVKRSYHIQYNKAI